MKCFGNIVGLGFKPNPTIYYSYLDAVFRHQMLKQVQHDIPFFRNAAGIETCSILKRRSHSNWRSLSLYRYPYSLAMACVFWSIHALDGGYAV